MPDDRERDDPLLSGTDEFSIWFTDEASWPMDVKATLVVVSCLAAVFGAAFVFVRLVGLR